MAARWQIPDPVFPSLTADEDYWTQEHQDHSYQNTWSMLADKGVRDRIRLELRNIGARKVLIPGCGTSGTLEVDLAGDAMIEAVVCTDFRGVIDVVAGRVDHPKVQYEACDSARLPWKQTFDAVVVVNSILSNLDAENYEIVAACFESLRLGGYLMGYFPTILCAAETDYLVPELEFGRLISLPENRFFEKAMGVQQLFYSPLRLRRMFRRVGFEFKSMYVEFLDSEYFTQHSREYYGLDDPDLCVYEFFVIAQRPLTLSNGN